MNWCRNHFARKFPLLWRFLPLQPSLSILLKNTASPCSLLDETTRRLVTPIATELSDKVSYRFFIVFKRIFILISRISLTFAPTKRMIAFAKPTDYSMKKTMITIMILGLSLSLNAQELNEENGKKPKTEKNKEKGKKKEKKEKEEKEGEHEHGSADHEHHNGQSGAAANQRGSGAGNGDGKGSGSGDGSGSRHEADEKVENAGQNAATEAEQKKRESEAKIKELEEEISENESKLKNAREKVETQLANKEITQEEADEKLNRIVEDEKK